MKVNSWVAILASLGGADAFWRMECRGRLGVARIDPLMSPGTASQHAHVIHGSSGFNDKVTHEQLVDGNCTSCIVTQDKSAYWTPSVYFKHANGTYELVPQVGGMLAYYFLNQDAKNPNGQIQAFPNDFRMIAGDSTRRNYSIAGLSYLSPDPEKSVWASLGQTNQYDLSQRALGFNCLDYQKAPEGSLQRHYLPDKAYLDANCPDGVRFELSFPSCWNGKDTDSPDHKSHVAYPDLVLNGNCPDGFDVKLPGLFYETIWNTYAFNGVDGEFVISNGDVQGFGYHGDFISGWDANFLQQAVNTCTNLSGLVQDCHIFTLQDELTQGQCKLDVPPIIASEKDMGLIGESLPGGVVIQYGPGPALGNNPQTVPVSVAVPTVTYKPGTTVSGSDYMPGGVFKETSTPIVPSSSQSHQVNALAEQAPSTTAAPTPSDPPAPTGYEVVRTDYITNGNLVNKVVVIETVETVLETTTTVTVTATYGSDKARRELLQHVHRHRHGSH